MRDLDTSGVGWMVRVLGPVDLLTDDGPVSAGGPHERTLLAALAVSANHAVSQDQLAQILWEDCPPRSRDNTLQTYISRLRHRLDGHHLVATDHAYELIVGPDELDALIFERLLNEATAQQSDPGECLRLCRDAMLLWRGNPFGELADHDPFRLEGIRLTELRLYAMELQMECMIALGREEMTVGTLEALVHEYPYRERMWFLLVSALALSGRRVEALRACENLRRILSEVGLEPSSDLRQIEEEILLDQPEVRPRLRVRREENRQG